jgi:hypothetical protein
MEGVHKNAGGNQPKLTAAYPSTLSLTLPTPPSTSYTPTESAALSPLPKPTQLFRRGGVKEGLGGPKIVDVEVEAREEGGVSAGEAVDVFNEGRSGWARVDRAKTASPMSVFRTCTCSFASLLCFLHLSLPLPCRFHSLSIPCRLGLFIVIPLRFVLLTLSRLLVCRLYYHQPSNLLATGLALM